MKKLFLVALALVGFSFASQAQLISPNAIGLRLGDSDGMGAEISYQRALGLDNRLEIDFGWRDGNHHDGVKLTGIYQWVWNIDGGFNWYAGPGAGLASYDEHHANGHDHYDDHDTFLFIGGDIGIEYSFDFPLLLSLDLRPEWGFGDSAHDNNDLDFDLAIGVRYQF
ncbi:hypothetical protein [Mangrovimonas sp. YM274]|uniref:hypothetical protein n=1 Tax=Mangrovimonas sp. YM274 TaxID=3070660 RepID=UPI0027DDBFA1|nr:hypothetical protein [Mangrovimonas sp. YM274]WMI67380.1 hypothetical protein RBH95_09485 [Mangrovimonas sp. YM274]